MKPPLILLLSPQHIAYSTESYIKHTADLHKIKNPVARELEPRAGMRRFEITSADAHTCDLQWPRELRNKVFAAHVGSHRT